MVYDVLGVNTIEEDVYYTQDQKSSMAEELLIQEIAARVLR